MRKISVLIVLLLVVSASTVNLFSHAVSTWAYNAVPPANNLDLSSAYSENGCGGDAESGHITKVLKCVQFGHFLFDVHYGQREDPVNSWLMYINPSQSSKFNPCEDIDALMSSHLSDDPNLITFADALLLNNRYPSDRADVERRCGETLTYFRMTFSAILVPTLEPGICGGTPGSGIPADGALGKTCIEYGDLLFDVIGVRQGDSLGYYPIPGQQGNASGEDHLLGLCQITRTDGFTVTYPPAADDPDAESFDDNAECPENSVMLLLSNTTKTANKPTLQGDAGEHYSLSQLKTNYDSTWESWKGLPISNGAVETLSDLVIARDFQVKEGREMSDDSSQCNYSDGIDDCNNSIGSWKTACSSDETQDSCIDYVNDVSKRESIFPLSSFEACTLYSDGCNPDIESSDGWNYGPNPNYDPNMINVLDYSSDWALRTYGIVNGAAVSSEGWVNSDGYSSGKSAWNDRRPNGGVVRPAMFVDLVPREQKPISVVLDHPELNNFVSIASGGSSSRGFEWESLTPDVCTIEGAATGALKTLQKFKLLDSGECDIQIRKGPDSIFVEGGYKTDGYKVSKLSYSVGGEPDETGVQNEKAFTVAPLETKVSSNRGSIKRPGYHFNAWTADGVNPIAFGSKFTFDTDTVLTPFWIFGDPPVESQPESGCDTVEKDGQIVCINQINDNAEIDASDSKLGLAKPSSLASTGQTPLQVLFFFLLAVLSLSLAASASIIRLLRETFATTISFDFLPLPPPPLPND